MDEISKILENIGKTNVPWFVKARGSMVFFIFGLCFLLIKYKTTIKKIKENINAMKQDLENVPNIVVIGIVIIIIIFIVIIFIFSY